MSRGLNKVMIIGYLGKDPEMRYTPSGKPVTTFNIAASRTWNTSSGERRTETEWFTVVAWSSLAEICNQYVHKGDKVFIAGQLTADAETGGPRLWTTQQGETRASFEVRADTVRFLSKKQEAEYEPAGPADVGDGDIPF